MSSSSITIDYLEVPKHDAPVFRVPVLNDGVAFDLTGWDVALYVLPSADDANSAAVVTRNTGAAGGITVSAPASSGVVIIEFTPENMALLSPAWLYAFRLVVSTSDGSVGVVVSGYLIITTP